MGTRGHLSCLAASVAIALIAVACDQAALGGTWTWLHYGLDFAVCWACAYALVMAAAAATIYTRPSASRISQA